VMDVRARVEQFLSVALERSQVIGRSIARSSSVLFTSGQPVDKRPSVVAVRGRDQLRVIAIALAGVVAAALVRYLVGANEAAAAFLLMSAIVAYSASAGGWPAAVVAALGAMLIARVTAHVGPLSAGLFFVESLAITSLVMTFKASLRERGLTLDSANLRIGELNASEQYGRTLNAACRQLEEVSHDHALIFLDRQGKITAWGVSAEQLYGKGSQSAVGASGAILFADESADGVFKRLLAEAVRSGSAKYAGRHLRADGAIFDADVDLRLVSQMAGDGFTMLLHDRTPDQERQAAAMANAEAQRSVRQEADLAQRQLATLRAVTDPSLNELAPSDLAVELLDRVRAAVSADGVALVVARTIQSKRFLSSSNGLRPDGLRDERALDTLSGSGSRIVLVQNDRERVSERSLLRWPAEVGSLIAVPVVHAGDIVGSLEVVDVKARRSTEWEIALIQVAAARIAALARDRRQDIQVA
jgi:PAS domain S-box-containing protein